MVVSRFLWLCRSLLTAAVLLWNDKMKAVVYWYFSLNCYDQFFLRTDGFMTVQIILIIATQEYGRFLTFFIIFWTDSKLFRQHNLQYRNNVNYCLWKHHGCIVNATIMSKCCYHTFPSSLKNWQKQEEDRATDSVRHWGKFM